MSRKRDGKRGKNTEGEPQGVVRGCLRWTGLVFAMGCGTIFLLALVMTIFEDPEAVVETETPGAVDRRMTEAFADIPTEGAGTATRTAIPTFDATVEFGALTATAAAEVVPSATVAPTRVTGATGELMAYPVPRRWRSEGANFRSCPELSEGCDLGRWVSAGQGVTVLGEIEGANWQGVTTWYYVEVDGTYGYVHSLLVADVSPVAVEAQAATGGEGSTTTTQQPANCTEAVAMGLTAQQAAQWSHLDRDGDGVACYGD